jgi:hypothetical protein
MRTTLKLLAAGVVMLTAAQADAGEFPAPGPLGPRYAPPYGRSDVPLGLRRATRWPRSPPTSAPPSPARWPASPCN